MLWNVVIPNSSAIPTSKSVEHIRRDCKEDNDRIIDLQCWSMKMNLVFTRPGKKYPKEDIESKLWTFLEYELGIDHNVDFANVHHYGRHVQRKLRPIVARFIYHLVTLTLFWTPLTEFISIFHLRWGKTNGSVPCYSVLQTKWCEFSIGWRPNIRQRQTLQWTWRQWKWWKWSRNAVQGWTMDFSRALRERTPLHTG
jgi:hypothetical protein